MWMMLVVAGVFVIGALCNFFGSERNVTEGIGGLVLASIISLAWIVLRKQQKQSEDFLVWLAANAHEVEGNGGFYNGILITGKTEITQYHASLSFLLMTVRSTSRFYVVGYDSGLGVASLFTAVSLILGWWHLPWGPVHTVHAVFKNLRGGTRQRTDQLLDDLRNPKTTD